MIPATAAPKKAPPVKTDTTAPLMTNRGQLGVDEQGGRARIWFTGTYISFADGLWNVVTKEGEATAPPMTPRS